MSIFSKLGHGGITVRVKAPSSVAGNQAIPVTVEVTSEETKTVKGIKAEIKVESRETGVSFGGMNDMNGMNNGGVGMNEGSSGYRTIAVAENRDEFTINAGETKSFDFQLYIQGNVGGPNGANLPGAVGALMNLATSMEHVNYLYRVYGYAEVDGSMNAKDEQAIQILPAEQANSQVVNNLAEQPASQPEAMPMQSPMAPPAPIQPEQPTQTEPDNNQNNPV